VKLGETIKFIIQNNGKILHEFVIGTKKELDEHAAMMVKFPNMEHDEPYMAHVAAGKKGEIIWQFNKAGDFDFACLIAGHYQAGMVGKIKVSARKFGSTSNITKGAQHENNRHSNHSFRFIFSLTCRPTSNLS
jgi:plastocyanin